MFDQRDYNELRGVSKKDSKDVPIKVKNSINQLRYLPNVPNSHILKIAFEVITHVSFEVGWYLIMLKPHSVSIYDWIGLQSERLGFDARCHHIPSEYTQSTCSLNQWVRKSCGLNHECRGLENISSLSVPCLNCGGGDRWCRHLSSFREFSLS
ncbi:hypothetical protein TNCV_1484531 [Trichonephila clavipes]|nr:hypothetical protein TNCV_1484531 [Trichonephila clavipes]